MKRSRRVSTGLHRARRDEEIIAEKTERVHSESKWSTHDAEKCNQTRGELEAETERRVDPKERKKKVKFVKFVTPKLRFVGPADGRIISDTC